MSNSEHKRPAQTMRVLRWLETGNRLTQSEAMDSLGVLRLASRIDELRQEGYDIETKMIAVLNRYGERCRIASYALWQEAEEVSA